MRDASRHRKPSKRGKLKFLTLGSGRHVFFSEALDQARKDFHAMARWVSYADRLVTDRADEATLAEWDLERLEQLLDDVRNWLAALDKYVAERRGRRTTEERVEALRRIAGREPAEIESYLRKADELERRLAGDTR